MLQMQEERHAARRKIQPKKKMLENTLVHPTEVFRLKEQSTSGQHYAKNQSTEVQLVAKKRFCNEQPTEEHLIKRQSDLKPPLKENYKKDLEVGNHMEQCADIRPHDYLMTFADEPQTEGQNGNLFVTKIFNSYYI